MWLAVHLGLEEYRAIKCVPKKLADYETFRREALILKELHHPGIPVVYDLEEDQDYFYLIEEYLEGHSLYHLITHQGTLKEAEAVRYGIQLCSLVQFMHSACDKPILHLDLQPKNLIICNGTVRLIDFDHAADSIRANETSKRYGTKGCAAPEQYTSDRTLDQRTDIYAIGAVLRFMACKDPCSGESPSFDVSETLKAIIQRCMEPEAEKRYSTAQETGEALKRLLLRLEEAPESETAVPSLHVILAGNRHGAGATHLGFALCSYLAGRGLKVLYEEHNPSGAVRTLMGTGKSRADGYGIFHYKNCFLKPWYGPAACLKEPEGFDVILEDFGLQWTDAGRELDLGGGFLIAVICESPWETGCTGRLLEQAGALKANRSFPALLVLRHISQKRFPGSLFSSSGLFSSLFPVGFLKEKRIRFPLFGTPEYNCPFEPDDSTRAFLKELWESVSEKSTT